MRYEYSGTTAAYHARDWAAARTDDEIRAEIDRVNEMITRTRDWQEVGSAERDRMRILTLTAVLRERAEAREEHP